MPLEELIEFDLDGAYLITGCLDGSVLKWQVVEEELYRVQLQWGVANGTLAMAGASIQDVPGLSQINRQLLKAASNDW
jgi:hypothetical protein